MLVIVDGHITHISAYLARRFVAHGIYVVILPSHMSTVLQPADNGLQALIKKLYRIEVRFARAISTIENTQSHSTQLGILLQAHIHRSITDIDTLKCVVRVIQELNKHSSVLHAAFKRAGFNSGRVDCSSFTPNRFVSGMPHRDASLPTVTPALLSQVIRDFAVCILNTYAHTQLLSPRVFAQQPGAPFVLAMSSASHAQHIAAGAMLDRYEVLVADLAMPRLPNENIISYVLRRAGNEEAAENGVILR